MKRLILILLLLAFSCTKPNFDFDWEVDVPASDVRFIFLPTGIDSKTLTMGVEVEICESSSSGYNEAIFGNFLAASSQSSNSNSFKIMAKPPAMNIRKEIIIRKNIKIPDFLYDKRVTGSRLNFEKLSRYWSKDLSLRFYELRTKAVESGCNLVVISQALYTRPDYNSEETTGTYMVELRALIGTEK